MFRLFFLKICFISLLSVFDQLMAQELNVLNKIFKHQVDLYDENQENKIARIETQENVNSDFVKLEIEGFISKKNVSIDKGKVYLKTQTEYLYQKDGDEKPFLKIFMGCDLRLIKTYRENVKVKLVGYFKRVDVISLNQKINKFEEISSSQKDVYVNFINKKYHTCQLKKKSIGMIDSISI